MPDASASPDAPAPPGRAVTVCLVILTVIASAGALYWLRPVLIPFVLALFATLALSSVTELLVTRLRVPRPLALPLTLALGVLLFASLAALVSASVAQLAANRADYAAQLSEILARGAALLPADLRAALPSDPIAELSEMAVGTVRGLLSSVSNAVLDLVSKSFLVLIFTLFLLIGTNAREPATGTWLEVESRVQRYLVVKASVSAVTGLLVGLVLAALGVPLAMVFGLFAFLLNLIPSVGSVIATLLPLPVVIVSPEVGSLAAVLAIALPALLQVAIGNVIEPRILGESLDLHPVVILLALMFWGTLWGIVGMVLATPIAAVMKIFFDKLESTRVLADLMAGRLDALRTPAA